MPLTFTRTSCSLYDILTAHLWSVVRQIIFQRNWPDTNNCHVTMPKEVFYLGMIIITNYLLTSQHKDSRANKTLSPFKHYTPETVFKLQIFQYSLQPKNTKKSSLFTAKYTSDVLNILDTFNSFCMSVYKQNKLTYTYLKIGPC